MGIIYLTPHAPLVVGDGGPDHDLEPAAGAPEITAEMRLAGARALQEALYEDYRMGLCTAESITSQVLSACFGVGRD